MEVYAKEEEDARGGPAQEACLACHKIASHTWCLSVPHEGHTSNWLQMHKGGVGAHSMRSERQVGDARALSCAFSAALQDG